MKFPSLLVVAARVVQMSVLAMLYRFGAKKPGNSEILKWRHFQ